ncbi:DUF3592 domain-containing protein [Chryseobacterium sp. JJR-5R]|uniref:DUF3592 domain-containing protein n=1 Tax=Chryseobacterium sp. JJR-5R TaxID=3093923 RepID=UPI002A75D2C9|nr:DUF3592 domain-containing protein [Chryseobacterium sp. JJR-5R]WPO82724.1 DUF3592 domain-containing protein [Chryseobacterium sp. JJR-5R]
MSNSRIPDITVSLFFISFTLILLTLGGGGIFYSAGKLGKNFLFVFTGSRTEGKIIAYSGSYTTNNKGNSTKMYTPVIQYTDHTGTVREIETDYSSSSRESNDEATVYYDPVKPARAVRGGFMSLFFWPFLILCFSLMGLSIALYLAKAMIKGLKKPKG